MLIFILVQNMIAETANNLSMTVRARDILGVKKLPIFVNYPIDINEEEVVRFRWLIHNLIKAKRLKELSGQNAIIRYPV